MFGMAVDEDRHDAVAFFLLWSTDAGLKALCLRIVTAISRLHRPRLGHDAASLDCATRIDRECHHLTAKQRIAGLQAGLGWRRTRIEPTFEGDLGYLALRFRRLADHCRFA